MEVSTEHPTPAATRPTSHTPPALCDVNQQQDRPHPGRELHVIRREKCWSGFSGWCFRDRQGVPRAVAVAPGIFAAAQGRHKPAGPSASNHWLQPFVIQMMMSQCLHRYWALNI